MLKKYPGTSWSSDVQRHLLSNRSRLTAEKPSGRVDPRPGQSAVENTEGRGEDAEPDGERPVYFWSGVLGGGSAGGGAGAAAAAAEQPLVAGQPLVVQTGAEMPAVVAAAAVRVAPPGLAVLLAVAGAEAAGGAADGGGVPGGGGTEAAGGVRPAGRWRRRWAAAAVAPRPAGAAAGGGGGGGAEEPQAAAGLPGASLQRPRRRGRQVDRFTHPERSKIMNSSAFSCGGKARYAWNSSQGMTLLLFLLFRRRP